MSRRASALAARQHGDLLVDVVAREEEGAEDGAHARRQCVRVGVLHLLHHGGLAVQRVGVVLRVVARRDVAAEHHAAAVGRELAGDDLEERGLAGAVGADDGDLLAAADREVDPIEDDEVAVGLRDALDADDLVGRARAGREAEAHRLAALEHLDVVELLERLHLALRHGGLAGLGAEAIDEPLEALALAGDVLGRRLQDARLLGALDGVRLVVAAVLADALRLEADDARDLLVEELAVVRDEDEGVAVPLEELAEPGHRRHVEVVGRLVEEEQIRLLEQERGEDRAHLPAARQLAEVAPGVAGGEAEAGQDAHGLVLREELLEVGGAIGQVGDAAGQREELVVAGIARGGCLEVGLGGGVLVVELQAPGDARQHEVAQRDAALDREVLRQVADAQAAPPLDATAVDRLLLGDDAQERRLAGAVGPDEADAVVLGHAQGQPLDDDPAGEPEADVLEHQEAHVRPSL